MRLDYWMLGGFAFFLLAAVSYLLFPITMIVIGLIAGAISLYYNYTTDFADGIISVGTWTWKNWPITFVAVVLLTALFVFLTKRIQRSRRFSHLRVKPNKAH